MRLHQESIQISSQRQGLREITPEIEQVVAKSGLRRGLVHVFCQHTSCSLVLMENADPSARRDLEGWMDRLVPSHDRHFTHTAEGPDDMPSHIKMALTRSSETLPLIDGHLALGTWQGVFLWEHRASPHHRHLVVTVTGTA